MISRLRANAFGGSSRTRLQTTLKQISQPVTIRINPPLCLWGGVCATLAFLAGIGWWTIQDPKDMALAAYEESAQVIDMSKLMPLAAVGAKKSATVVKDGAWKELTISAKTPAVLNEDMSEALRFQYSEFLPVAKLDGAITGFALPKFIWLKMEQPGNAFLVIETDAGALIRPLSEMSPGFISRCDLDPASFGTLDGKPAYVDSKLVIKTLWIIQDAPADPRRIPGWVAVERPADPPAKNSAPALQLANLL